MARPVETKTDKRLVIGVILIVSILTALRFAFTGTIELLPEEAYYWMYSKHPALSYFDHPPMVAWIISAGRTIFGDTQLEVRFGTIVLWIFSCELSFLTGRFWFGRRAALVTTLLFTLAPIFVGTGFLVTPDAPLVFFWLLTLYLISLAVRRDRPNCWLLAGVSFGGALLSKYYAVLLAPSVLLFLLLSPANRKWLRRPQVWLGLFIGLALFSPVVIWNAQHDWASFIFQSTRANLAQNHLLRNVVWFWLMQAAMLGPVFFPLFVWTAARAMKRGWLEGDARWNFVGSFSLPLFFLFAAASFKTEIHINWSAPCFLSLAVGAGAVVVDGLAAPQASRAKRWRIGAGLGVASSVALIVFGHTSLAWDFPKVFAYSRAGGWRALAEQVARSREELHRQTGLRPFVLGIDKYSVAAELGFYLGEPDDCVNQFALGGRGLAFPYWTDLREFENRPAVAVFMKDAEEPLSKLRHHFDRVGQPVRIELQNRGARRHRGWLVQCQGYHAEAQRDVH